MSERFWEPGDPPESIKNWTSEIALNAIDRFIAAAGAVLDQRGEKIEIQITSLEKPLEPGKPQDYFCMVYDLADLLGEHIKFCIEFDDHESLQLLGSSLGKMADEARKAAAGLAPDIEQPPREDYP